MSLLVNIRHLEHVEQHLQGELSVEELDLGAGDELAHARLPLEYDLTVRQVGRDILATGRLGITLDCECARCLKPFAWRLEMPEWTLHLPLDGPEKVETKNDSVDLTPFLREDILLEYPQHLLCEADCAGLSNRTEAGHAKTPGQSLAPGASAWAELNKLKF